MRTRPAGPGLLLLMLLLLPAPSPGESAATGTAMTRGDEAWERRSRIQRQPEAHREATQEAVEAYRQALERDPDSLEAAWKLLRSLYTLGEYSVRDPERRLELYREGRRVAESAVQGLEQGAGVEDLRELEPEAAAAALESEPEATPTLFWSAVLWGVWGESTGKLEAARQGVGERIHDLARIVIALDPEFEEGGGYRLLGRLHTEAPKIPLVTGWVDRNMALESLEKAHRIAPGHFHNRLYLAEALLRFRPSERGRAMDLLTQLVNSRPSPEKWLSESAAVEEARELLSREAGGGP